MALTISQIIAASFNDVENEMRKPENQWAENAALREFERQGMINTVPGGPQVEATLDYRRNPGAGFLASDLDPVSLVKTEVLTAAVYDPAQLSVPIVWSKGDEAKNPETNQKVNLVKSLLENAINSHDDLIEQAIFSTTTNGFLGFQSLIPDSGQGSPGGIDSSVEAWWRNYAADATLSAATIEADMTLAYNVCSKGSGSSLQPTLLVTNAQLHATFEGTQQGLQRYVETQEAKAGFKLLAFKTARMIYSQYATARIYLLNPKSFSIDMYKLAKRKLGDTLEIPGANGYERKIYTMLQAKTNNKSRLGVLF